MPNKPDYDHFKVTTSFTITEHARDVLQEWTDLYGLKSRSDLIERLTRNLIPGVLWLNTTDKDIAIDALFDYIQERKKLVKEEEDKRDRGEEWDEEFVVFESFRIASIRLTLYRLRGNGENSQVDSTKKMYEKLHKKILARRLQKEADELEIEEVDEQETG